LRQQVESRSFNLQRTNVLATAAVLRSFVMELPKPLMGPNSYKNWLEAANEGDREKRVATMKQLIDELPDLNRTVLRRLLGLLCKVVKNSSTNGMGPPRLAAVWAPAILKSELPRPETAMEDMAVASAAVMQMMDSYNVLFGASVKTPNASPRPIVSPRPTQASKPSPRDAPSPRKALPPKPAGLKVKRTFGKKKLPSQPPRKRPMKKFVYKQKHAKGKRRLKVMPTRKPPIAKAAPPKIVEKKVEEKEPEIRIKQTTGDSWDSLDSSDDDLEEASESEEDDGHVDELRIKGAGADMEDSQMLGVLGLMLSADKRNSLRDSMTFGKSE